MAEAEAGSDDDAEDRAREGAVGDGFGEEDAPVEVCERADEAAESPDERGVQAGDDEEAQDDDASPSASRAEARVSRNVSRAFTGSVPVSRTVSRAVRVP